MSDFSDYPRDSKFFDPVNKKVTGKIKDNMADNTYMLRDEEHIAKLIKKAFEDEFKKQEENLVKIITGNFEITMQEIKSLKNKVNELKKTMELTQNDLEERVNNVEENECQVKEDLKEIYEYHIDPDYVNDSLMDIRNKLTELEDSSRRNNKRIDGIAEEPGETWEECKGKVQPLLNEEPYINDVVIERVHRVKVYSPEKKNSEKLRSRTVVCKPLSFVDKARILNNSHCLKGTSYYVN